jgi:hypothetical protein
MLLTIPHGLKPVGLAPALLEVIVTDFTVVVGALVRPINCAVLSPARSAKHMAKAVDDHILAGAVPEYGKTL